MIHWKCSLYFLTLRNQDSEKWELDANGPQGLCFSGGGGVVNVLRMFISLNKREVESGRCNTCNKTRSYFYFLPV